MQTARCSHRAPAHAGAPVVLPPRPIRSRQTKRVSRQASVQVVAYAAVPSVIEQPPRLKEAKPLPTRVENAADDPS